MDVKALRATRVAIKHNSIDTSMQGIRATQGTNSMQQPTFGQQLTEERARERRASERTRVASAVPRFCLGSRQRERQAWRQLSPERLPFLVEPINFCRKIINSLTEANVVRQKRARPCTLGVLFL